MDNRITNKIQNVKRDMEEIISNIYKEKFWIDYYGAYDINPDNLVFWICVETDVLKEQLKVDKSLISELRSLLTKYDYPEKSIDAVFIGFESQETVDKESGGDWYLYFK